MQDYVVDFRNCMPNNFLGNYISKLKCKFMVSSSKIHTAKYLTINVNNRTIENDDMDAITLNSSNQKIIKMQCRLFALYHKV